MKRILLCLSFALSTHALTAQRTIDSIKVATSEWHHLQQVNTEMTALLKDAKKTGQDNAELIKKLQAENEKLREIMREYIQQIDRLNNTNLQLTEELEKCEDE